METIQSTSWLGLFGTTLKKWYHCCTRPGRHGRFVAVTLALVGFMFLIQGCNKNAVPVDILTVTPSAAAPGEIIRIGITEPGEDTQYRVMFADTKVSPLRFSEGFLTVMVPYLEAGLYTLSVVPENEESGCGIITFTIKEPAPVTGKEAENLFNNIGKLLEFSEDYTLFAYTGIGGPAENADKLAEGFQNCKKLIEEALNELGNLPEEDLQIVCELIKGSKLGDSLATSIKVLENDRITKYHEILGKASVGGTLGNTEFFFTMTRLDLISAILTDVRSVMKGIKYVSLLANFVPALGQFVSAGAWASLSVVEQPLKLADALMDGVIPTDLKQVNLEVIPETGALLNPGESASVAMLGTFGSQIPFTEVAADILLDAIISDILDWCANDIRHFLDDIPGMDVDLRTNYAKDLLDAVRDVLVDAGFDVADNIFDMPWEDVTLGGNLLGWRYNIPLNVDYYYFEPLMQIVVGFGSLLPFFGDDLTMAFQDLMLDVMGENSILTNEVISVDDEEIVSAYDRSTGMIYAEKAGKTTLHARAYRYEQVIDLLWLFEIEGWKYLEEGEEVTLPTGAIEEVNIPLEITVSTAPDPVNSDLTGSPVSGVLPGIFTTDGGTFQISVSPVDENGDLLYENLTVNNFSFSPIQVAPLASPDTPVAFGTATPDSIESVLPGEPGKGVNVAIVLDSSGSMSWNDSNRERVIAAKSLVDMLGVNDRAAIFDFGAGSTSSFTDTRLLQEFTADHTLLYQAIDQVVADGGTPMYESLYETIDYIYGVGLSNLALVVLTDGEANSDDLFDEVVANAQDTGVPIFAVGLGYEVDFTQLQALASQTGGTFAAANDALGLQNLFESIGVAVSAGRLIVHASGGFAPAIQTVGPYIISGELRTKISGLTIPTPFDFRVDVVSTAKGLELKMANMN